MKKEYILRVRCHHPGCQEIGFYKFDTKAEYSEGYKSDRYSKWMCSRHTNPDSVLTMDNLSVEFFEEKEALPVKGVSGLYWHKNGKAGSGFTFGTGYKAWAKDFPEGSKLVVSVSAKIILP